ncbi:calmodulin-like [Littorina saxatilis]|uniref:calmodulin-like n=1 Tax=Littorina saxatilis TaxID=31220 RepID=UPI0038B59949
MTQTFSEEQIAELKQAFSLFDKDADGYLTAEEAGVAMRASGCSLTETHLKELVENAGKDNNGQMDFVDFLTLMARITGSIDSQEEADVMLEALTLFDKDNSGVISTGVLRHVLTSMGEQLTSAEVEELVKEADKEGTGKIDYKEFVKMMTS